MKTDPQHLLEAHVPFYRRRKFWGIIFVITFIFSISSILFFSAQRNHSFFDPELIPFLISSATGGFVWQMFANSLLPNGGYALGGSVHFVVMLYLCFKTFQKNIVSLRYPVIFLMILIFGLYAAINFIRFFY